MASDSDCPRLSQIVPDCPSPSLEKCLNPTSMDKGFSPGLMGAVKSHPGDLPDLPDRPEYHDFRGWRSITTSYFDVNYRCTSFDPSSYNFMIINGFRVSWDLQGGIHLAKGTPPYFNRKLMYQMRSIHCHALYYILEGNGPPLNQARVCAPRGRVCAPRIGQV